MPETNIVADVAPRYGTTIRKALNIAKELEGRGWLTRERQKGVGLPCVTI